MADDDDYLTYDDDWLYIEDEYALADELVESQIADPGYAGTNYGIAAKSDEFELFDYWEDCEYADDGYFDHANESQERHRTSEKPLTKKRRKLGTRIKAVPGPPDRECEPLLFRSREERNRLAKQPAPRLKAGASFAFLPDWRSRLVDANCAMPSEAKSAEIQKAVNAAQAEAEDDEAESQIGDGNPYDNEPNIDSDMLQAILKEKLKQAGLDGMEEAGFMQTLAALMSGEVDASDAAGDLANTLLDRLNSVSGDNALSGWLSQQGVSLEEQDDSNGDDNDDDEEDDGDDVQVAVISTKTRDGSSPVDTHSTTETLTSTDALTKRRAALGLHGEPPRKRAKATNDRSLASLSNRDGSKQESTLHDLPPSTGASVSEQPKGTHSVKEARKRQASSMDEVQDMQDRKRTKKTSK